MPACLVVLNCRSGEKSQRGVIRYRCPACKRTYSFSKRKTWQKKKWLFWLEKYSLGGLTYHQLSAWSGYTVRSIEKQFHRLLIQTPLPLKLPALIQDEAYLLVDGLWFGKRYCLMLYRHSKRKLLLSASFMAKEYGSLIAKDLELLKTDYRFTAVVSDGGTGVRKAIFRVFGHIPHQICLAHLHRDVINAIGRYPKDKRIKDLKQLADHVWLIESKAALSWWRDKLQEWIVENREFMNETRHVEGIGWWYVHKGVRKAVRILVSLLDTSFKFLDHPLMPKTTNELEGSISVLSRKHQIHKGLKRNRVQPFLKWFIYFYNRKILSQRKN